MTTHESQLTTFARGMLRPSPTQTPVEWCEENIRFDEAEYRGPFLVRRAEYIRDIINDFANRSLTDIVLCWGSQTKKTGCLMAGALWSIRHDPGGIFWVMPTASLARKFSKQRLMPMIRASLADLVPIKAARHDFSTCDMLLGAAVVNLTGSNSPANLSSTPSRRIILDEVDKFDDGGRGEADAVNLAEQRSKNVPCPQRWKTSTPTLYTALIWQEFQKGDQQRYHVQCPHCAKEILLAWSKQFTVFKLTGNEAFVAWDKEAKQKGEWDLARVLRSAHAVCPHCAGEIRDGHKTKMIRDGVWRPTAPAAASFRSRHLPSMYAATPETGFGRLAVKFLQAKKALQGLQGFINGDLGEPYQSQDTAAERIVLITDRVKCEVTTEWKKMLTLDCQQRAPYFWFVARAWNGRDSEGFSAGPLNAWEDVRRIQLANNIPDVMVAVDSGYGAKDDAEVYLNCARFGEMVPRPDGLLQFVGWLPTKGMPSRRRWKDPLTGQSLPWNVSAVDPYADTAEAGRVTMPLLEFPSELFKDILARFRAQENGIKWSVTASVSTDEYWRHLDGWIRREVRGKFNNQTVTRWLPRDNRWPDHLGDCEVLQIMLASFHGLFPID